MLHTGTPLHRRTVPGELDGSGETGLLFDRYENRKISQAERSIRSPCDNLTVESFWSHFFPGRLHVGKQK